FDNWKTPYNEAYIIAREKAGPAKISPGSGLLSLLQPTLGDFPADDVGALRVHMVRIAKMLLQRQPLVRHDRERRSIPLGQFPDLIEIRLLLRRIAAADGFLEQLGSGNLQD